VAEAVPFVDLRAQYESIERDIDGAIRSVLDRTDWILGADVRDFEDEFATFCEAGGAVGVDAGTSALELALRALGVGPGDEVITAANTFIATVIAITSTGARPVLVDVDPKTYLMDASHVEKALTERTRALVPVHLYGQPVDMDPIIDLARAHDLLVVEDACQAHGARYKGRRVGSLGDAAAFSFYPSKNLGAYGDGGSVVSNNPEVLEQVRALRNYGQRERYHHEIRGFNRRLDTIQAAVLRVKLPHLDHWNRRRRSHAAAYDTALTSAGLKGPCVRGDVEPVWHLYVVEVLNREDVQQKLTDAGIGWGVHYPIPVHMQLAYRDLGYKPGDFPVTERSAGRILSLPMYPELRTDFIERVANALIGAVETADVRGS
jgi:dTDP-4-amino-4,6-dideoxygalactose transaminase